MASDIKYNDSVIASIAAGQKAVLMCAGSQMNGEVVVFAEHPIDITYNGSTITQLRTGQTATIKCNNKIMIDNITIGTPNASYSILGEAVLGLMVLGNSAGKLTVPTIRLEDVEMEKLETPTIRLEVDVLETPTIRLEVDVLETPTIYLA